MSTHPKKAMPKALAEVLNCSMEGCTFHTKKSAYSKQELGRHMKFVHGVNGASSSAQLMQSKKAPNMVILAQSKDVPEEQLLSVFKQMIPEPTVTEPPAKRTYTRRSTVNVGYDTQALITVGKIIAACEAEAEKFGASKESFTRRCAELFYASQVR